MRFEAHHLRWTSKKMWPQATQQAAWLTGDRLPPRGLERPAGISGSPWCVVITDDPLPWALRHCHSANSWLPSGQRAESSKVPGPFYAAAAAAEETSASCLSLGDSPHPILPQRWALAAIYDLGELGALGQNLYHLPQKWLTQLWAAGWTGQRSW